MKAGIYEMSEEDYFAVDAISKTELTYFDRSPAHYQAYLTEPKKDPTPEMLVGKAFDLLVFTPEEFVRRVITDKPINKNRKDYKQWRAYQEETIEDIIIIPQEKYDAVLSMYQNMKKKKRIQEILFDGWAQRAIIWQDPKTGIWCKGLVDWINKSGIIADLKKARTADWEGFGRQAGTLKYHWQGAWYLMGITLITGIEHRDFRFIAVEDEKPFESAVYRCDLVQIRTAQDHMLYLLDKLQTCRELNWWPGYPDELRDLGIPDWTLKKEQVTDQYNIEIGF